MAGMSPSPSPSPTLSVFVEMVSEIFITYELVCMFDVKNKLSSIYRTFMNSQSERQN